MSQSIDPESLHPVFNPATGEIITHIPFANSETIHKTIHHAKRAFASWSQVTPLKRARVIFKFKNLLEENSDKLANLITLEHGKVLEDAKGEILRGIELVEFVCGIPYLLKGTYSENVGTNIDSYTIRQPLGVCVGITPFNFPVMIPIWMFISAIACGNTFILKPSEKDPSAPLLLMELMKAAGLPEGVLNILNGTQEVVNQLITHPDVAAVSCVGSTPVAEAIYHKAIQAGKRAHTFGGAKNHCVVMPDADIDETVSAIVGAAYGAAGERCMAISVVVALDAIADSLVEKLKQHISTLKVAPGIERDADMGPLVTKEHWQRVHHYIQLGIDEGATLLVDGRQLKIAGHEQGFFMGPCLFDNVQPLMRIYQEEIFGPVLIIMRVPDFQSAISLINHHAFGNGTAIFTNDGAAARAFASKVEVGMVGINVPIPVPVAYHTFGGWKRSLFGDLQMHGTESIAFYTKSKTVTVRWMNQKNQKINYHMPAE